MLNDVDKQQSKRRNKKSDACYLESFTLQVFSFAICGDSVSQTLGVGIFSKCQNDLLHFPSLAIVTVTPAGGGRLAAHGNIADNSLSMLHCASCFCEEV